MQGRLNACLALAGCLGAGGGTALLLPDEKPTQVTFLSVGQGDCTLIQSDGITILVDVGPKSEDFDAGSRLVAPKLRDRGIDSVDLVFLTHPDIDHIGGLAGLKSKTRIEKVAVAGYFKGQPDLERELQEAGVEDKDVLWLDSDSACHVGGSRLDIRLPNYNKGDPDNEGSLFIKWSNHGHSVVMTGDANSDTEIQELGKEDWGADILKVGHHGSSHSSGPTWLRAVHPKVAVVSCGRHNRYGHPAPSTIQRVVEAGAQLLRTDLDGDIEFEWIKGSFKRVRKL